MPKFELEQQSTEVKKQKKIEISEKDFRPSKEDLDALLEEGQRPVTEKTDKILSPEKNALRLKALRKKLEKGEQQPPLIKEKR